MSSREVHPIPSVEMSNFEANPSAMEVWNLPQQLADQHRHHVIFLWSKYDWEEGRKSIAMVSLRSKQFVASSHQFVLGPPKKQPEDFCDSPPPGNGKIRIETSPPLPGLRKSNGGKNEKTYPFVVIKV